MNRTLFALAALACATSTAQAQTPNAYDIARTSLVTSAAKKPSPQPYDKTTPKGVETIRYTSSAGDLLAWVMRPKGDSATPRPVMVFAHGGFALGGGDDEMAQPFVDAGFIVVLPAVRGENGNPGNFELFLGEVDDVIAAGRKAKTLPGANPDHIYLFGHSIGGGLATLVNLSEANPYKLVGATGGNYSLANCARIAGQWGSFDIMNKEECHARFPDAHLPTMTKPLYSYVGDSDFYALSWGKNFKSIANENYHLGVVQGDHFSSVAPSIKAFIEQINSHTAKH